MKAFRIWLIIMFTLAQQAQAQHTVKIVRLSGAVNVRPGVEETWQPAAPGQILEEIDTIITGPDGRVELLTHDGKTFTLYSNSSLDVLDIRHITEKELFLFLMSKKVERIEPRKEKTQLKVGNVSVVHGEARTRNEEAASPASDSDKWAWEKNGARALYDQQFYPNTIVKLHKILGKYPDIEDCGEIHFYLGKSFEALNKNGQALDAYDEAIQRHKNQNCQAPWVDQAQTAIKKLNQN
ncbi:MAG: hypothetical protein ACOY90_00025 [Candidatus Zhuqueibacterota bacterium]